MPQKAVTTTRLELKAKKLFVELASLVKKINRHDEYLGENQFDEQYFSQHDSTFLL